ncbi:MAG: plastocyanin/azurin family copper-binding protein [Candidatus Limnocylindrales bacterium]
MIRRILPHRTRPALRLTVATTLAVALALPSLARAQDEIGIGTPEQPRDIAISMDDTLRFDPAEITVGAGEVVRFVLTNTGAATHDFLIGDLETQEEHGAEMAAGMMHGHSACPESEDHAEDAMADDDMMVGDDMASHMPDDEDSMGHMDEADDHMDEADDHMDEVAEHAEAELCPGGIPAPVTIGSGETVSVLARLDEPGETLIGCHQPGHWPAGMKGIITVVETASSSPMASPGS